MPYPAGYEQDRKIRVEEWVLVFNCQQGTGTGKGDGKKAGLSQFLGDQLKRLEYYDNTMMS